MNPNDIMENTGQTQQNNPQLGEQVASAMKGKAQAVKDTAQQWQRQASNVTRKTAAATDLYVHENPWIVVGCVAISCFAIGLLIGRNRS
jgi:ElaB/YqjD/DUF883 family membrane-anchored ribosome-binding protein